LVDNVDTDGDGLPDDSIIGPPNPNYQRELAAWKTKRLAWEQSDACASSARAPLETLFGFGLIAAIPVLHAAGYLQIRFHRHMESVEA
jgi:hypothetical protein